MVLTVGDQNGRRQQVAKLNSVISNASLIIDASTLQDLVDVGWLPYYYASRFLKAFLDNDPVPDANSWPAVTIKNDNTILYHNTGVVWQNGSPPYGDLLQNVYEDDNPLADKIRNSSEFYSLMWDTLNHNKYAVRYAKLHSWPIDNKFQFHLVNPQNGIQFNTSTSPDLHFAIGLGHFVNSVDRDSVPGVPITLVATVDKTTLALQRLDISGTLYDLFDFDVNAGTPSLIAAGVQASYNPDGGVNWGHIFETLVHLDQENYSIQFNFGGR